MTKSNGKTKTPEHVPQSEAEYVLAVRARLAGAVTLEQELSAKGAEAAAVYDAAVAERDPLRVKAHVENSPQAKEALHELNQRIMNAEDVMVGYQRALAEAQANVKALTRELEIAVEQEAHADYERAEAASAEAGAAFLAALEKCGATWRTYLATLAELDNKARRAGTRSYIDIRKRALVDRVKVLLLGERVIHRSVDRLWWAPSEEQTAALESAFTPTEEAEPA